MDASTYWIGIGDIHDDVADLSRLSALPDAAGVIISGDLTVLGDAAKARRVIEGIRQHHPVICAQIGNMDRADVDVYLSEQGINLHASGRVTPEGVGIFGVGWSTPTPFHTPSEASEEQIAVWLDTAYATVADCAHLLLVSHTPPLNTTTDRVSSGMHVGSRVVREYIERIQPEVCLTGHIHESRAEDRIGRTVIVNPGAFVERGYARIGFTPETGLTASVQTL